MRCALAGLLLCLSATPAALADDAVDDVPADLQDVLAGFHARDVAARMDAYARLEIVLVDDPELGSRCLPRLRDVLRRRGPKERARVMPLLALVDDPAAVETWLDRLDPETEPDARVRHAAVDAARLRAGDQAVARALIRLIRTPTTPVPARSLAVEALGHLRDAAPLVLLAKGAPNDPWVVTACRALALGHRKDDASIEPLVALMVHDDLGVRVCAWESLTRRTSQNLPPEAKPWQAWFERWCARKQEKAPPSNPDEETRYAPTKHVHVPTYYGIPIPRPRSHVVFCLDVSQSMYGDGIGHARKHLRKTLRDLPGTHHFEIVAFNENIMPWSSRLVRAHPVEKYLAIEWLDELETLTYTNIYDAVETAFQYMGRGRKPADDPVVLDAVFLLSDGAPNRGRHRTDDRVVKHIGLLSKRDVPVHTIGAGEKVFDLLKRIARETGGTFVDAFE